MFVDRLMDGSVWELPLVYVLVRGMYAVGAPLVLVDYDESLVGLVGFGSGLRSAAGRSLFCPETHCC